MKYVKFFDILDVETAQIPCIEVKGPPTTATVGAVGLLALDIDSDGDVYVCISVNGDIYTWKPLKDGKDGVCIIKAEINTNGELVLTLSDGNTLNAGVVKGNDGATGQKGTNGKDGVSVKSTHINDKGELIIEFSDNSETNVGVVRGIDGQNGVSIVSVEKTSNYELIINLSNNTKINLGSIKSDYVSLADDSRKVNGIEIKKDADGNIRIDGNVVKHKNVIWEGEQTASLTIPLVIENDEDFKKGDVLEIEGYSDNLIFGSIKIRAVVHSEYPFSSAYPENCIFTERLGSSNDSEKEYTILAFLSSSNHLKITGVRECSLTKDASTNSLTRVIVDYPITITKVHRVVETQDSGKSIELFTTGVGESGFVGGTVVTVNGEQVEVFNADNKQNVTDQNLATENKVVVGAINELKNEIDNIKQDIADGVDNGDEIIPMLHINPVTNYWEVSYDNGLTYTSLGVKATGPQGDAGKDGEDGYTPQKGTDYWTPDDKAEIKEELEQEWQGIIDEVTNILAGINNGGSTGESGGTGESGSTGESEPGPLENEITINLSEYSFTNQQAVTYVDFEEIHSVFEQGTSSTTPNYYEPAVRLYKGNTLTIDAGGKTFSQIVFTFVSGFAPESGEFESDDGYYDYTTYTWTGSAQTVKFTVAANLRLQSYKVS